MPGVYYDFSAMRFSADSVALCATTGGTLLPPAPHETEILWEDILHNFVQAGWGRVADLLGKMSYTCDALGTFAIHGTGLQHQEVFRRLTPYYSRLPGARRSEAQMTVSVRFFRAHHHAQRLSVHHWMGCVRVLEDGGPLHPLPKLSTADRDPFLQHVT